MTMAADGEDFKMLPVFKDESQPFMLMQTKWAAELNPVLAFPPLSGSILKGISLSIGVNTINHLLGRLQQGWILTDQSGGASIYRSKPFNATTLALTSDAVVTINLWVF